MSYSFPCCSMQYEHFAYRKLAHIKYPTPLLRKRHRKADTETLHNFANTRFITVLII